jgi:hypothetical protein
MQGPPRYFSPSETEQAVRIDDQIHAMAIEKERTRNAAIAVVAYINPRTWQWDWLGWQVFAPIVVPIVISAAVV